MNGKERRGFLEGFIRVWDAKRMGDREWEVRESLQESRSLLGVNRGRLGGFCLKIHV